MQPSTTRILLIIVTAFAALSAIGGGVGIAATNGIGIPLAYLQTTPFVTYFVPGLILSIVVGGSALVATILVWQRHPWGALVSIGAGAIMIGWIIGEILLIRQLAWLQLVYVLNGLLMVVLGGIEELLTDHLFTRRVALH